MAKYVIKKDTASNYYWILKSTENGKTVVKSSEAYETKTGVRKSISWTQANAKTTVIVDEA